MATRPQTNAEARNKLIAELQANSRKLRDAAAKGDKDAYEKYSQNDRQLSAQLRATAEFAGVPIGAIGSGLQTGLSGLATAIPDIVGGIGGLLSGSNTPSVGQRTNQALGISSEPTSNEAAPTFRMAQGFSSSAMPGIGARGAAIGTGLGAADVAVSDVTGFPEGVASGLYGMASLTKAGFTGIKNWNETRKFDKFLADLPTDEANALSKFMLKGQGSDSPIAAAAYQKLMSNPKFAEMFHQMEKAATSATLKGMEPVSKITDQGQAATSIFQAVQNRLSGLKQHGAESLFEKAKGYGAGNPLVDVTNTVANIDKLIGRYSTQSTPNAEKAVEALNKIKSRLTTSTVVDPSQQAFSGLGITPEVTSKRTVEQVQGVLSEFGKKAAANDNLIKDLSLSDERIISSAIFGGMKDDLVNSLKGAEGADKVALNLLSTARNKTSAAMEKYNEAIAQGLPKDLHNKSLAEIAPEDLFNTYKSLTPKQQSTMRSWVQDTDKEALNFLDKRLYNEFVDSAKKTTASGEYGVDLGTLVDKWKGLSPAGKESLATSLGSNAAEFESRMNDASKFARRMKVAQPQTDALIDTKTQGELAAAVGSIPVLGYPGAKATQLGVDVLNKAGSLGKLSDEQLMKVLLTPEGASFLKQAGMTPGSAKTLEELTKLQDVPMPREGWLKTASAVSRAAAPTNESVSVPATEQTQENDIYIPEEFMGMAAQPTNAQAPVDDIYIPPSLTGGQQ